ncbi:hypothetical protein, partial [Klebsiella pneumoniae]|uniref:hypothetical protein n=1 Tax=Klebsiella pneumoniae TaxID=573 RepID=UPI001BDF9C20
KRAYCLKTQPATGETYPKSDLFNKAPIMLGIFLMGLLNGLSNKPDLAQKKGYKSTNKQKPG